MRCSQCGNQLPAGTLYCTRCGHLLEAGVAGDKGSPRRGRRWLYALVVVIGAMAVAGVSLTFVFGLRPDSPARYGFELTYKAVGVEGGPAQERMIAEQLNHYLENIGIRDFSVVTRSKGGDIYVTIELAKADDRKRVAGTWGGLQFRLVEDSRKASDVANDPVWRETPAAERAPDKEIVLPLEEAKGRTMLRLGPALMTGEAIKRAKVMVDEPGDDYRIAFTLTGEGAEEFDEITTLNVNKQLAIVFDYRVLSAPTIHAPIREGAVEITGKFTEREAENMAAALNAGNLPFELEPVKEGEE